MTPARGQNATPTGARTWTLVDQGKHIGDERELPPNVSISAIAELGSLVGDPARANMLVGLLVDRTLTAKQMAERAGVMPQTASGHIAKLKAAGLIRIDRVGRHHLHRLTSPSVATLLEALHMTSLDVCSGGAATAPLIDEEQRIARICHDHLGGRLAVKIAETLVLDSTTARLRLSAHGRARLDRWGIALGDMEPLGTCESCIDWSENVPHIAGALGAAILKRSVDSGWLRRGRDGRSLQLTGAGVHGFHQRFGVRMQTAA